MNCHGQTLHLAASIVDRYLCTRFSKEANGIGARHLHERRANATHTAMLRNMRRGASSRGNYNSGGACGNHAYSHAPPMPTAAGSDHNNFCWWEEDEVYSTANDNHYYAECDEDDKDDDEDEAHYSPLDRELIKFMYRDDFQHDVDAWVEAQNFNNRWTLRAVAIAALWVSIVIV